MRIWEEKVLAKLAKSTYEEYMTILGNKLTMRPYEQLEIEVQQAWQRIVTYCYDMGFHDSAEGLKKDENPTQFPFYDLDSGLVIVAALRYCYGRRTYMPSSVVEWTMLHWEKINPKDRKTIADDVSQFINSGLSLGDNCDAQTWNNFNAWLQKKLPTG